MKGIFSTLTKPLDFPKPLTNLSVRVFAHTTPPFRSRQCPPPHLFNFSCCLMSTFDHLCCLREMMPKPHTMANKRLTPLAFVEG